MENSPVRIHAEELLSDNWYVLKKYTFDLRRRDGSCSPRPGRLV